MPGPCPVAPLVPQMIRAIRQHHRFDLVSADLQDAAFQRTLEIEAAVSHLRPASREGALLAVMVAFGHLQQLVEHVPEAHAAAAQPVREDLERCLMGAALALRTVETAALFDWYMTRLLEREEAAA